MYEAFNWRHGVFVGSAMRSEATAAAEHKGECLPASLLCPPCLFSPSLSQTFLLPTPSQVYLCPIPFP